MQRVLLPGHVGRRLHEQAVDEGAVLARGREVLRRPQLQLRQQGVVDLRQLAQLARLERVHLRCFGGRAAQHRQVAVRAQRQVRHRAPRAGQLLHGAARGRGPADVHDAVVTDREVERLAVGRPGERAVHRAVERRGEDLRLAAPGRDDGELLELIGREARLVALNVGDPLAVRAPRRAPAVGADERRELLRRRAGLRVDHVDIRVLRAVRIRAARADEGDLRPVGRQHGRAVLVLVLRNLLRLLRGDVENPDVRVEPLPVALAVLLELVPVDDDGRRRLALPALELLGLARRVLVAHGEDEARAVGRPRVVADAAVDRSQLLRLAAGPVQQPDLGALLLLVLRAPAGEEREVAVVGAPSRGGLVVGRGGQADGPGAVPARHPDVAVALVLLDVRRGHRVRDPLAVRRSLRVADGPDLREIVESDGASGRSLPGGQHSREQGERQHEHEDGLHGAHWSASVMEESEAL